MTRRSEPAARAVLAAVVVTLALTVGPRPAVAAATGDEPEASADAPRVTVTIGDAVAPALVEVAVGSTVTWHNADDRRHRVRSTSGPTRVDSGNLEPGERYVATFGAAGTYAYVDHRDEDDGAYHGTVVVGGSAAPQTPSAGPASESAPPPPSPPPPSQAPSQVEVRIPDRNFAPADVVVAVGGTVTWRNDSDDEHTVTSADDGAGGGGGFDSGLLAGGATFAQRFDDPGTHRYVCLLHDEMTGTVEVTGRPSEAPSGGGRAEPVASVGAGPGAQRPAVLGAAGLGIGALLVLLGLLVLRRRRRSARTEARA